MTDLYAVLGLGRDAKPIQIKSAYRKKAKAAHPDHGGSADIFAELNQAYRILANPALRALYDETGCAEALLPETIDAPALILINGLLAQILANDENFLEVDIVKAMSEALAKEIVNHRKAITKLTRAQGRAQRMKGRFRLRDGRAENRFDPWLDWHVGYSADEIKVNKQHVAHRERAIEILQGYTFQPEMRAPPPLRRPQSFSVPRGC